MRLLLCLLKMRGKVSAFGIACLLMMGSVAQAHEWHRETLPPAGAEREALREHLLQEWQQAHAPAPLTQPVVLATNLTGVSALRLALGAAGVAGSQAPAQAGVFQKFPKLQLRWDSDFLYIGSNGMPDHNMMVGITNWQQQVPLPHPYFGSNAWRLPLHPVVAQQSVSIKGRFLRGAIALAVNGIPIFNPQNNRGEVSQEIGELDQWGGHCGRADDYHYHAAPLHLQSIVGKGQPIAYALDGYPIFGLTEPDGSPLGKLDECNGHDAPGVGYHYHASMKYPYLNGGFHGEVVEAGGQVDPQPRAGGVRGAGTPLRGAKITGFEATGTSYKLSYEVSGEKRAILYSIGADGTYPFEYQNGSGGTSKEVYTQRQGGGDGGERGGPGGPGGPDRPRRDDGGGGPPPQGGPDEGRRRGPNGTGANEKKQAAAAPSSILSKPGPKTSFVLSSPAVTDGGALPVEFTGDGESASPPLSWKGAPTATKSYALIMHHLDPEGVTKVYWALYNIPAATTHLDKNMQGTGTSGLNTVNNRNGYAPPHSKGPGAKTYILTLFALSAPPQINADNSQVTGEMLAAALKDRTLASADLSVVYTRTAAGGSQNEEAGERRPPMREGGPGDQPPPPRPDEDSPGAQGGGRKPWLQQHGAELDASHDGVITLAELAGDMDRAFTIYDRDKDGVITKEELDATGDTRAGAAFAGLIFRHFADLDTNHDGRVTREEMVAAAKYIFNSADLDHDGKLTTAEWQNAPNAPLPVRTNSP